MPDLPAPSHVIGAALAGPHAACAETAGRMRRCPADVSPFAAAPHDANGDDWRSALEAGWQRLTLIDPPSAPASWRTALRLEALRMVLPAPTRPAAAADVVRLGAGDVPQMLALTAETHPGPFEPRTHELGAYFGIREGARLVAMAGQRMRPAGWTEISAVCTAPDRQGRGLARRAVSAAVPEAAARGDGAFLHVMGTNDGARRLYESMGFAVDAEVRIDVLVPADA